ncbi:MAG TPA: hypothetical protein VEC11_02255 [Allosphingosinicella sp.]|nr:hypothetical protein [Allosphingosinicella sp.]
MDGEVVGTAGDAVPLGIGTAAIDDRREVDDLADVKAGALRRRERRADGDIRLAGREIEMGLGRDQVDADAGIGVAERAHQGVDLRPCHFVGGQLHHPLERARTGSSGIGEGRGAFLDRFRGREQGLADLSQPVALLAPLEQDEAERLLEHGNPPRDGGLADLQLPGRGQRRAIPRDREEIAGVVPVEHGPFFISAERDCNIVGFAEPPRRLFGFPTRG